MLQLKSFPPGFQRNADRLRRFEQEAQAAGALNHPNILAIYDVTSVGQRFLVNSNAGAPPLQITVVINWTESPKR